MLTVSRGFHSTGMKRMGGGHGHDEPYYLHAKHMYNLDKMKHQGLKMSLAVFTAFSIGVAVPVYAVIFQQKKTASAQAHLLLLFAIRWIWGFQTSLLVLVFITALNFIYVQPSIQIFHIYLIIINFSALPNTCAWTLYCFAHLFRAFHQQFDYLVNAFLQSVLICSFRSFRC